MSSTALVPVDSTPTPGKVSIISRYIGSNATGAMTVLAVLAGISPENSQLVIMKLHVMYDAIQQFIGAFASIWYIVFPVVAVWLGKMGVDASGIGTMMNKVLALAKAGDVGAQVQVLNATGQLLAAPAATAPQLAAPVKAALLDATAALPEVVGDINVTDKHLAEATVSEQIVKTKGMPT